MTAVTVQSHTRRPDGTFELAVRVPGARTDAFACIAGSAEQDGADVLVTLDWPADAPVEQQLAETRRLVDRALEPPAPATSADLAEPGTEL